MREGARLNSEVSCPREPSPARGSTDNTGEEGVCRAQWWWPISVIQLLSCEVGGRAEGAEGEKIHCYVNGLKMVGTEERSHYKGSRSPVVLYDTDVLFRGAQKRGEFDDVGLS